MLSFSFWQEGVFMNASKQRITQGVLDQFVQMCRHPHPSYGEKPLADYVERLLRERGLSPLRDEWNNIVADVPASLGREDAPLTVIQGHLDMVCAVKPGSGYDPKTSPVAAVVKDGWLCSDGNSSLGADNNLGNAAVLWLMDQNVPHGPVRLLFTTAEEVGLQGAKRVEPRWLEGASYLINTDGFLLGSAVVSSAGGLRERFVRALAEEKPSKQAVFRLELTGFPGGHSGYDIHRGRINPIGALAGFLRRLPMEYDLLSLEGGHAENAIPMNCTALLAVEPQDSAALRTRAEELSKELSGPNGGQVRLEQADCTGKGAWTVSDRQAVLDILCGLFVGVYAWRDRGKNQVSASANLGYIRQEQGQVVVSGFIRACHQEEEDALSLMHGQTAQSSGFTVERDAYPGWPERPGNRLTETLVTAWKKVTGTALELTAVHVGLEPSVLGAKNPQMLMVSTGPTILDPHSVDERAPLDGLADYVCLLEEVLNGLSV